MKKTYKILIIIGVLAVVIIMPYQTSSQENPKDRAVSISDTAADTIPINISKKMSYEDVIPENALSDSGLFNVYKVDDKYYFELPYDILEKEILVVSRISRLSKYIKHGGAGMKSHLQQVIRWQKIDGKIFMRSVSYQSTADPDKPIYKSVLSNNFESIISVFDIKAIDKDSTAYVIEVNSLFTTDIPAIGPLAQGTKKRYGIGSLDSKRSFINSIKAFPKNVEIRHTLTYNGTNMPNNITNTLSLEMNQSFIMLPQVPMQRRYYDERVPYFSIEQIDYGLADHKATKQKFINRWRLEPADIEAYHRGELVKPIKPIVYYIDPATPEKWRSYIKQGVNDWQKVFEKAGFKNAIMAKDPPSKKENPDWSPEDVRYSVIRYISTEKANAQGPHVHDPRTGEILESDILWYHNLQNALRNSYFLQTAAVNKEAQTHKFKDEVMGQLIRLVTTHEVGHTLGLPHNFGSSSAYPVDSLRSPTFTSNHGTAPSIMDYARYNYIAQPEDGVTNFLPAIGEYDIWSIIYGYKLIPEITSPEEEQPILNNWIKEKADDPFYRFADNKVDPSAQSEDLGDDPVKASRLGLDNLKRILPNLIEWTKEDGKNYDNLSELYGKLVDQYKEYIGHVTTNVGGLYCRSKTADEEGRLYTTVPKSKQQESVRFINKHVFRTPDWLIDENILERIEHGGMIERIRSLQSEALSNLFDKDRLIRLIEGESLHGNEVYTIMNLFDDTRKGVYSEFNTGIIPDAYRRNLHRNYIDILVNLIKIEDDKYNQTDIKAVALGTLNSIQRDIKIAKKKNKIINDVKAFHLKELSSRISKIMENNKSK